MANNGNSPEFNIHQIEAEQKTPDQYVIPAALQQKPAGPNDISQFEAASPNYNNMGWGQVAKNFIKQAPTHAGEVYEGIYNLATNLPDVASTLYTGAKGIPTYLNNLPPSALTERRRAAARQYDPANFSGPYNPPNSSENAAPYNPFGMPPEELQRSQDILNGITSHYTNTYGPVLKNRDYSGVKKSLSERPFDILMDFSMVNPAAGAALRSAGVAEKAGVAGNVVGKLARGVELANPVSAPLWGAGKVLQHLPAGLGQFQSFLTDIPASTIERARLAGSSSDPAARANFMQFMNGERNISEIAKNYTKAFEEYIANNKARYLQDRRALAANTRELNLQEGGHFSPLYVADELERYAFPKNAISPILSSDVEKIRKAIDLVQEAATNTDPAFRTMDQLDYTRRAIKGLYSQINDTHAKGVVNDLGNSIRDLIVKNDPNYANLLEEWQSGLQAIDRFKNAIGKGEGGRELVNLSRIMKIASSEGVGAKGKMSLLDDLANSTESGRYLREQIAGATLSPKFSGKSAWVKDAAASGLLGALMHVYGPGALYTIAAAGTGMAASSPRLAGLGHYYAGRASKIVPDTVKKALSMTAPVVAGPEARNIAAKLGQIPVQPAAEDYGTPLTGQSTGGRIERREGGRVGIDHSGRAASLVRAAEAAKKQESKTTEPLLQAPDEHIVKALSIANEAI